MPSGSAETVVAKGMCYPLFAYEVAQSIDLDAAERRMRVVTERQTVKHKRRAPAYFEYRPAPIRVTLDGAVHGVGGYRTLPSVELVLYDFGAVSVSYSIPIDGPLSGLPGLSYELWGNTRLLEDSRGHVERLMATLGDAAVRPRIAAFVEDYAIFHIEAFATPCDAVALATEHAVTVAQILRAEPHALSQQEVADATASRLSFGPNDAAFIDTDATVLFDPEGDDVRAVVEFANTQLLEMRYLDQELDDALDRSYEMLTRRRWSRVRARRYGPDLLQLAELHMDGALLFERVTNALKLVGEQYLARIYGLVSRRFRLAEWDAGITRKLQAIDSIYGKMADRVAARRMELLEWIIIVLIAFSILISFRSVAPH
ncbi:MAG TPA: hypothetical protein VLV16_14125 [Gemmatimonadales bacterium]|nr:hypothetical protein [Gemmatimonadales bacterium]